MVGEHGFVQDDWTSYAIRSYSTSIRVGRQDLAKFNFPACPGGSTMTCPACAGHRVRASESLCRSIVNLMTDSQAAGHAKFATKSKTWNFPPMQKKVAILYALRLPFKIITFEEFCLELNKKQEKLWRNFHATMWIWSERFSPRLGDPIDLAGPLRARWESLRKFVSQTLSAETEGSRIRFGTMGSPNQRMDFGRAQLMWDFCPANLPKARSKCSVNAGESGFPTPLAWTWVQQTCEWRLRAI